MQEKMGKSFKHQGVRFTGLIAASRASINGASCS
jgi:hypothetical protein